MSNNLAKRTRALKNLRGNFISPGIDLNQLKTKITQLQKGTGIAYGSISKPSEALHAYRNDLKQLATDIQNAIKVKGIKDMASTLADSTVKNIEVRESMNAVFKQIVERGVAKSVATTFIGNVLVGGVKSVEERLLQDSVSEQAVVLEEVQSVVDTLIGSVIAVENKSEDEVKHQENVLPLSKENVSRLPTSELGNKWLSSSESDDDFSELGFGVGNTSGTSSDTYLEKVAQQEPTTNKNFVIDALYTFYKKVLEFLDYITLGYFSTETKEAEKPSALRSNSFLSFDKDRVVDTSDDMKNGLYS